MGKRRSAPIVAPDVLARGYRLAIENSQRLFRASAKLIHEGHASVALGLAQIGQEEVGKSLSILAAIGLRPIPAAWENFWREWRNHQIKAHRAYLYEILNPQRLEVWGRDGVRHDGGPLRATISEEKEASFYVNYDEVRGEFVAPASAVDTIDASSRLATLGYLALTASAVHDALVGDQAEFRFTAFSEVAFRLCTERIYQQDGTAILGEFANRSPQHAALIRDLRASFASNKLGTRAGKGIRSQSDSSRSDSGE
jgi:AbiV family abortive infection protein